MPINQHNSSGILRMATRPKFHEMDVSWPEFLRLAEALAAKLPNRYRTWLLIGTNGFRVGAALCNAVGYSTIKKANLACIQAKHYSGKRRKEKVFLSPILGKLMEPILIIDDIIDSGETILAAKKKIRKRSSDVAVIFKKPWSKVKPDYYVEETDKWVVFPWERQ
jgi:hypoxanthine phosphoribosyltransferase